MGVLETLLLKLLMDAPTEVADVKALIADVGAAPDVVGKVKAALSDAVKCLTDAGF